MKRYWKALALAAVLALSTACNNSTVDEGDSEATTEIVIGDSANYDEGKEVKESRYAEIKQMFDDAMAKINNAESLTIESDVVKKMKSLEPENPDDMIIDIFAIAKCKIKGEEGTFDVSYASNGEMGSWQAYCKDGTLYHFEGMVSEEEKTVDEYVKHVNADTISFGVENIEKIIETDEDNYMHYYITFDASTAKDLFTTYIPAVQDLFEIEDDNINYKSINLDVYFDKTDNSVSSFTFRIENEFVKEDSAGESFYYEKANRYSNLNQTEITVPDFYNDHLGYKEYYGEIATGVGQKSDEILN